MREHRIMGYTEYEVYQQPVTRGRRGEWRYGGGKGGTDRERKAREEFWKSADYAEQTDPALKKKNRKQEKEIRSRMEEAGGG